ncbi:MAG: histidine phosphatase family protein, partial [Pseudonocardiaceae bacterium]
MSRTLVHLLRHGEVHNPEQILYGRLPGFQLSDVGVRQAERVAAYLGNHDVVHVVTSPLLRAQQTAALIATAHGVD